MPPPTGCSIRFGAGCISRGLPRYGSPIFGWLAVETRVTLTYAAVWVIALNAWQADRPNLIRTPRLVLAHVWEGAEL
jgi:hypothetical protein